MPGKQNCSLSLAHLSPGVCPSTGTLGRGTGSKSGVGLIQLHTRAVVRGIFLMSVCAEWTSLGMVFYARTWKCSMWRGLKGEQGEGTGWGASRWGGVCAPWLAEEHRSWWLCFCMAKSLNFRLLGSASAFRAFCMYTQMCVGVKVISTFHADTVPIKYSSEEDSHLYILYYSGLEIFQWLSCCLQDLDSRDKTGGSLIFYI